MIIETFMMIMTTVTGTGIAGFLSYYLSRPGNREMRIANKVHPAPAQISAPISQEMRDEIEQNEAWWLRSYHSLMLRSGAEVAIRIIGEEYSEKNANGNVAVNYRTPDLVALEGCICGECERVRKDTEKMSTEVVMLETVDISFNNPTLVREIQRAYGHAPDGVCGPALMHAMIHRTPAFRAMSLNAITLMNAYLAFVVEQEKQKLALSARAVDWEAEVAYWTALDRKKSRKYA